MELDIAEQDPAPSPDVAPYPATTQPETTSESEEESVTDEPILTVMQFEDDSNSESEALNLFLCVDDELRQSSSVRCIAKVYKDSVIS